MVLSPTDLGHNHPSAREQDPPIKFLGERLRREVPPVDLVARAVGKAAFFPPFRPAARHPFERGLDQDQLLAHPSGLLQEAPSVLERKQALEEGSEDPTEGALRKR